uniref:DNA cross-link repair 1A protein isoform X2 n=1 Tax=Jaculus jaculus TaxID=51337 RepID=UPI001E1B011D|nr:DNA cross-link repair 1A protein isoform X2 [Jaculus jaculus]
MLEDSFLEEEIWEYKSKSQPKPVPPSNGSANIPESVGKATEGKYQSKRKRNKKRTIGEKEKAKNCDMCPGETDCQMLADSSQNSSSTDCIQQSQDKETTPRKHCRTHKSKQVSPKIRPVYEGYCPNCQMPFSSLLGQTPRWHVFECLDSPTAFDTECPDGLQCTSTIPSHYKKYTHLLLAQSRASNEPFSSPPPPSGGSFSASKPDFSYKLEQKWSVHPKQIENLKTVSDDSLLVTRRLATSQPPTEINKKIPSSPNTQMSQAALPFTELVIEDKLVGVGLPLAQEELDSQSNSQCTDLPLPENDFGSCEISYSPLQSDEETYDIDEKLDDSQELFLTQSSKDGSLEEDDDSPAMLKERHGPLPKDPEGSSPAVASFLVQDKCKELRRCSALNDSFQLVSQTDGLLFSLSSMGAYATSDYQTSKAKPDEAKELHLSPSSKQKQVTEESAVCNQVSLPLLKSSASKRFEREEEGPPPMRSQTRELPSKNACTNNRANSACVCRKVSNGTPSLAKSLKLSPTGPKLSASQPSPKVMKQMDIGVYFGLPPKRQTEESLGEGVNLVPVVSPNKKMSRPGKRKAEKSLSDLEVDMNNLNENQLSVELTGKSSQRQRKRCKKSNSPQAGARQRSGHLVNHSELGTVSFSKSKVFRRSAHGRVQRGSMQNAESSNAEEFRRKTCPFYKKIPGTGFTVDAFQYGVIEGCTAYFLTHFHSDHYAGLSKNFTWPVYCSEITGNLLKNKLHMQEQYVHQLPMDTECIVEGVKVVLLDANHFPMVLSCCTPAISEQTPAWNVLFLQARKSTHCLTVSLRYVFRCHRYCSPEYTFPSQQEVIQFAINTAFEAVTLNPHALVVCGTYCIGKEKVFLAIADVLGSKVGMSQEKYKTLQYLNIPEINSLITTDMCNTVVHLLPMMQINFKCLQSHLKKCGGKYNQIIAFRPTGWTHSNKLTSMADVTPQTKGSISIYGIPYSEHSSYLEMKRFVQWLKPQKIIPVVNVGTLKSRRTMERHFKEWRLEAGY